MLHLIGSTNQTVLNLNLVKNKQAPNFWSMLTPAIAAFLIPGVGKENPVGGGEGVYFTSALIFLGDCGPPPEIPNATPEVDGKTSFPEKSFVVYSCNKDYRKIPDKQDTVSCQNDQWSSLDTFCNKSCSAPTRVTFASLKTEYIDLNYFPIGSTVQYKCRPGFRKVPLLSVKSTCLDNLEWSTVAEFCERKSCPNPGELQNGNINIPTDILFGSEIYFSCNTGYKLVGVDSVFCYVTEKTVEWSDQFPECIKILCPDPPPINNGNIRGESETYGYRHTVTYTCAKGFVLVGNSSIYCTVKDDQGEWSDPAPRCIEKYKIPSTTPKSTTVTVPTTRVPLTSPKPTRATQHVPAIKTTTHHPTRTTKEKGRSTSGGDRLITGKFDSQGVKRNCQHCGRPNQYLWKRILSFNCLRKTIKMRCLWAPKGRWVHAFYQHVLWTPLGTRYAPSYSQQCSCSKEAIGQLQIIWPVSRVALTAQCVSMLS
uniref:complement decay-accelerating factor, GPI-anchored-like n=1 Tax=Myodes glareolus TaxID=447135 RepID=UPI0020206E6E|nr:complement decay-accelerating factor, GPI-anchored-like [Myodes glareolus]